jgi:toxin ParE1/3/4
MADYRLSPRAQRDLDEIFDYTVAQWGLDQAVKYTLSISSLCGELAQAPEIAPRCDHFRKGYRRWNIARHAILFRVAPHGITVVRILHASRDIRRHLLEPLHSQFAASLGSSPPPLNFTCLGSVHSRIERSRPRSGLKIDVATLQGG